MPNIGGQINYLMYKYQEVTAASVGRLYSAGKLWHLTQKIAAKHSNKSAGSAFRAFHFRRGPSGTLMSTSFEEIPDSLEAAKKSTLWE